MSLEQIAGKLARSLVQEAAPLWREPPPPEMEAQVESLLRRAFAGDRAEAETALQAMARALACQDRDVSVLQALARSLLTQATPLLETAELAALHDLVPWALQTATVAFVKQGARMGETRFARLNQSGLIGVFVSDLSGKVLETNDAFLAMLGLSRDELPAGQVDLDRLSPPEWRAATEVARRQLRTTGAARPYEKEYLRKDGTRVPVILGAAMLDEDLCIAFAVDNTPRKRVEQLERDTVELEKENRRIVRQQRLKSEFLADLSHDLRSPLNAIIGFSQLLVDGTAGALEPQQKDFIGAVLSSGQKLLRLIGDVLDLVRLEAGKLEFRPEPVDLAALFEEIERTASESAAAKNIRVAAVVDPAVREGILLDPARFKQVLDGYVSNAIRFTPEGGEVTLWAGPQGTGELRVEVEDTGTGIAPDRLHRLLLEALQLESSRAKLFDRAGLGLVLTHRLVEAQGGRIEARSTPGKGSVFSAILPRVAAAAPPVLSRRTPVKAGTSVLVIEDDPEDQVTLVGTLEEAGYAVQVAGRGAEALALCRERRFDAITLDLLLPDMSGIDLLAQLRKTAFNSETPVLVVSIAADYAVGFAVNDVLQKPVSAPGLLASLSAAGVHPGGGGQVMVVDDDPDCLSLMTAALKQIGYQPTCFQDGEEGLRAAERTPPAAVVLDLVMPGIDGFQFLERLRNTPATCKTPVFVWTTKDLDASELDRLKRAAQSVVPKGRRAGIDSLLADLRRFTSMPPPVPSAGIEDPP